MGGPGPRRGAPRGLTAEEWQLFDRLFHEARRYASASTNVARVNPMEAVLVSILLEHEKRLARLKRRVREASDPSRFQM